MRELHFTKKDFRLEWFSGTGGGGQHRNKHQNCCRITHIETGIMSTGQTERDRPSNQKRAFNALAHKLIAHYQRLDEKGRDISNEEVRVYKEPLNQVIDHASGLRRPYVDVVIAGDLSGMIEARKMAREESTL